MASPPNSMHVVFSAECNHALTWQAVGLFASHAALRHPGNITRLLACSAEQLKTCPKQALETVSYTHLTLPTKRIV